MNRNSTNKHTPASSIKPADLSSFSSFLIIKKKQTTPHTSCINSFEAQNVPLRAPILLSSELEDSPKILKYTIGKPQLQIAIMEHIINILALPNHRYPSCAKLDRPVIFLASSKR